MPLIRYRIGDYGNWVENTCKCNRHKQPILKLGLFRANDLLLLKDGRKLEHFVITESINYIKHKFNLDFNQYQVMQEDYDFIVYIIKLKSNNIENQRIEIITYLENYYNTIFGYKVKINIVITKNHITGNGNTSKYKYFINRIIQRDISIPQEDIIKINSI